MAIIFNQAVKHDRFQFIPGVALEIPGAEHYFVACGWASETSSDPVFTYEGVEYDSNARSGDTGKHVLPDEASRPVEAE